MTKKLMVVDDSLSIRRKIERCACLEEEIHILTASNGKDAIALFKKELPDLVTMDLTMPNIGGVECIKELIEHKSDTHILVISALSDKGTAISAIMNGAEGFLKKPFSDEELNNALSELLSTEATGR